MPDSLSIVRRFFPEVTQVKDATRDLEIEVTRADTTSTAVKNHKACAMAVACKRALKLDGAVVSVRTVYLVKGASATRYQVREDVARELVSFDRGGAFAPGEYQLHKPAKMKPRGSGTRHKGDTRAGNTTPQHQTANIRTSLRAGAK